MAEQSPQIEALMVQAADGVGLSAKLFLGEAPRCAVIISSGTGFPQHFYAALASYLARRGAVVLTYDYRGIDGSGEAADFARIDIPDWGRFDLAAMIALMGARFRGLPLGHLGHSVGGHLIGFAPNQAEISRHALVCCGSGTWFKHWPSRWPLELFFWWGIGPSSIARFGRVTAKGGWRGADLPPQVFRTWRRWAHRAGYYQRDLPGLQPHSFDEVTAPIRSWIYTDDGIATPGTAADTLASYSAARSEVVVARPEDYDLPAIGHQGAFKSGREALWAPWWDWLSDA
ncbi:MAG: alpha/beta hydrolase [Pseudomonadota bacterium]